MKRFVQPPLKDAAVATDREQIFTVWRELQLGDGLAMTTHLRSEEYHRLIDIEGYENNNKDM